MTSESTATRVALMNNKGGVGKTLLTVVLAEALARHGKRVLVVDLDPQGNATRRLGVHPAPGRTLAEALRHGNATGSAADALYSCGWSTDAAERISVLAAVLDLEDRILDAGLPGAANRLRKALYGVDDGYDVVLIDCQPSMGHLTVNALAALDSPGDTILAPITPEHDAIAGARRAVDYVRLWREDLGVPLVDVTGLIVNQVRATTLHDARISQLGATFPDVPVLGEPVRLRALIASTQDRAGALLAERELSTSDLYDTAMTVARTITPIEVPS